MDWFRDMFQYALRWSQEFQQSGGAVLLLGFALVLMMLAISIRLFDNPIRKERRMAKTLERRRVADIISEAFDAALLENKLSPEERRKYSHRLGKALGLEDLIPGTKSYRYGDGRPDSNKIKLGIQRRLDAMGVHIATGLMKLRQRRKINKKSMIVPKH